MTSRRCVDCGHDPACGHANTSRIIDGEWDEAWLCHDDTHSCYTKETK